MIDGPPHGQGMFLDEVDMAAIIRHFDAGGERGSGTGCRKLNGINASAGIFFRK
jgi:hypothetical protein